MLGEFLLIIGIVVLLLVIAYQKVAIMPSGYKSVSLIILALVLIFLGGSFMSSDNHKEGLSAGSGMPLESLPIGNEYRVLNAQVVNGEEHFLLIGTGGKIVYYKTGDYINVSPGDWLAAVQTEKGKQLRTYSKS